MQKKLILSIACALITVLVAGYFYTSHLDTVATQAPSQAGDIYERPYSPSFGPENAKVTITEFFDPACEACRAFYPIVKEIMARHPEDVRVVLRYATFHKGSDTVVRMLEAARLQSVFEAVLDALLAEQAQWASHQNPSIDNAWNIAEKAGLDIRQAKEVMISAAFDQILEQEKEDIRTLKISQTPTFFVNQKPLPSFGPNQLYSLVVAEIKQ